MTSQLVVCLIIYLSKKIKSKIAVDLCNQQALDADPKVIKHVKITLSPSKNNYVICFIESPLKIMKNVFYFILKTLFFLKIFKSLS